jgi:hypothetical protein
VFKLLCSRPDQPNPHHDKDILPTKSLINLKTSSHVTIYAWWTHNYTHLFVCFLCDSAQWAMASSFTSLLDHTQRRTTVGRTPLDEWSARCRDLYITTYNTHNRQTSMLSAGERPQLTPDTARPLGPAFICLDLLIIVGWVSQSVQRLATSWTVRGSNPGVGEIFCTCSDWTRGPTQPPVQWVPGLSRG